MNESSANQFVSSEKLEWKSLPETGISGIFVKVLQYDEETQRAPTFLLKFEAGAKYPAHNHLGGEEIFVLEGDIRLGKEHLYAGDYLFTAPDNKHAARSVNGCVVLVKTPQAVEILRTQNT